MHFLHQPQPQSLSLFCLLNFVFFHQQPFCAFTEQMETEIQTVGFESEIKSAAGQENCRWKNVLGILLFTFLPVFKMAIAIWIIVQIEDMPINGISFINNFFFEKKQKQ